MSIPDQNGAPGASSPQPPGELPYRVPVGSFMSDWASRHYEKWWNALGMLAGQPIAGLEIGCYEGRSTCWFLQNIVTHEQARLYCVDPFAVPEWDQADASEREKYEKLESRFDANVAAAGGTARVVKLKGTSAEELPTIRNVSFDFVYIDGSHYAWDVLTDAVLSWRLLKVSGTLIFDDYGYYRIPSNGIPEDPTRGIDAFLSAFETRYELKRKTSQVILMKRW